MNVNREKKRVAHIGNMSNTCLQGESKLPADDYVFSILESMNTTLGTSEKRAISYQQLQEFRASKNQTVLDKDSEPSTSSISQNDSSYSNQKRRKILSSKTHPLMAKCQRNLKYLKHNRCIPKPRAHVGFVLPPAKERILNRPLEILEKQDYLTNDVSKNTSVVSRKKNKSTKVKLKISKEGSSEFDKDSTSKNLARKKKSVKNNMNKMEPNYNLPSKKISAVESEDEFENFIRKHHQPQKGKKRILDFSSDSESSVAPKSNSKVKNSKKKQNVKVTASIKVNQGALKSDDSSINQTKAFENNTPGNSVPLVEPKKTDKRSTVLSENVPDSNDEDSGDNSVNDFDSFWSDDSSGSEKSSVKNNTDAVNNTSVSSVPNVNSSSNIFDNLQKEDHLSCAYNKSETGTLETNSKVQDNENAGVMPCSVVLKRKSFSEKMSVKNSLNKSCINGDNCNKNTPIHSENPVLETRTELLSGCNFSNNSVRENGKIFNSQHSEHQIPFKKFDCSETNLLHDGYVMSNTENSLEKVTGFHSKSNVDGHSQLRTENINEKESSEICDSIISDDFSINCIGKNSSLQKSESSNMCSVKNLSLSSSVKSEKLCNLDTVNESNNTSTTNYNDSEFNVKIVSVQSLGDLNSVATINSSDDYVKNEQLNTESTKKLNESDIEIIDLELVLSPSKKEETNLFVQPEESMHTKLSQPSHRLTQTENEVIRVLKDVPLSQNILVCSKTSHVSSVNDGHCNKAAPLIQLSRANELSNVQTLKDCVDNSIKNCDQDSKLFALCNLNKEKSDNIGSTHTNLIHDDCIIIDDSSPDCSSRDNSDPSSKVDSSSLPDKNLVDQAVNDQGQSTAAVKSVDDMSLSNDKSSTKFYDCIIIDDDESPSTTLNSDDGQSNSAYISDKNVMEKVESAKNLSQTSAVGEVVNDDNLAPNRSSIELDDCVMIDDESPPPTSNSTHAKPLTMQSNDSAYISGKTLNETVKSMKNVSEPIAKSKELRDGSLDTNEFSTKMDNCIIIDDDDELVSPPIKLECNTDQTANKECSATIRNLSEELNPAIKIREPSIESMSNKNFPSNVSPKIVDCIIIDDDDECVSVTANSNSDNGKTAHVQNNDCTSFIKDSVSRNATNLENSREKYTSTENASRHVLSRDNSSRFKPDGSPRTQVLDILKVIDFEQIKKVLNDTSSDGCVENNSPSTAAINIYSNNLHHDKESFKNEAKLNENKLVSGNVKDKDQSDFLSKNEIVDKINSKNSSSGSSDLPEMYKDAGKNNLESSTEYNIHTNIKIENKCSSGLSETKASASFPCKTLKPITVCENKHLDLPTSINLHALNNAHKHEPSISEDIKQEVCVKNTLDQLDIFATCSVQGLNDPKQTNVTHLLDLYKEEFKKFHEIKRTGRNLSAGLNLLHVRQVEKLKQIQSSIKNVLKHDPCFHKLLKDKDEKQDQKIYQELEKKHSFQTPGPSPYSKTVQAEHDQGTPVKDTHPEDHKPFDSSIMENAENAIVSYSADLNDEKVYEQLKNVKCALCAKPAKAACQGCFKVYYCSTECGVIAWNESHYISCGT